MKTTCRYYDPENGWCRLKSSWKDSMPEIVECEAVGCAEFEEESGCEYCGDEFVPALDWQYGLDHILPDYKYCPMCGRNLREE